jgi:beta-lactamase class A
MKSLFTLAFAVFSLAIPALGQQTVPPKDRILFQKLESTIHETGKSLDGVLGVYVLDLATGNSIASNADETFPTASTIKIAILAELFHQAQQGKLNLNHIYTLNSSDLVGGSGIASALTPGVTKLTLRDLAALMISVSDNSLTNVLIDRVGMDNINSLLDSLGLSHTRLRRKMMDSKAAAEGRENVSTPREMSQLLQALYKEKVLNKQFTADFFNLLSVKKESYIPRLLPEDLRIANKPGELEGVRNDCGIVFTGKHPYALCVMTTYVRHEREAGDAIARISLAAYEMFDRLDRSSPLGRVVSSRDSSPP